MGIAAVKNTLWVVEKDFTSAAGLGKLGALANAIYKLVANIWPDFEKIGFFRGLYENVTQPGVVFFKKISPVMAFVNLSKNIAPFWKDWEKETAIELESFKKVSETDDEVDGQPKFSTMEVVEVIANNSIKFCSSCLSSYENFSGSSNGGVKSIRAFGGMSLDTLQQSLSYGGMICDVLAIKRRITKKNQEENLTNTSEKSNEKKSSPNSLEKKNEKKSSPNSLEKKNKEKTLADAPEQKNGAWEVLSSRDTVLTIVGHLNQLWMLHCPRLISEHSSVYVNMFAKLVPGVIGASISYAQNWIKESNAAAEATKIQKKAKRYDNGLTGRLQSMHNLAQ